MQIKRKINKWDPIKMKSFGATNETIKKSKRQCSERQKIMQMKQLTKDLSPKYMKSSCSSISEKQTTQSKTGQKT